MGTAGSVKKNEEFGTVPFNTIPLLKKRSTTKNANIKVTEVKLLAKKFLRILWVIFMMREESHVVKVF